MNEKNLYDSAAIAERIKLRAKSNSVQIKDVLEEAGLNKNVLSNLRSGRMILADNLACIADNLGCSVDYLLGRTTDPVAQHPDLTEDERQKIQDYVQFVLSQRK